MDSETRLDSLPMGSIALKTGPLSQPSSDRIPGKSFLKKVSIELSNSRLLTTPNRINLDEDGHTISSREDEILLGHASKCFDESSSSLTVTPEEDVQILSTESESEVEPVVSSRTNLTRQGTTPDAEETTTPCYTEEGEKTTQEMSSVKESMSTPKVCPFALKSSLKTPDSTNSTRSSGSSVGVSFDKIMIRHYVMDLSDHPSCSIGAPIGLSWEYEEIAPVDVDVYEFGRRPRRRMRYLVLNFYRRQEILKSRGYTDEELDEADKQRARIQRQRGSTRMLLSVSKLEELFQSAKRKVKRACCGSTKEPAVVRGQSIVCSTSRRA